MNTMRDLKREVKSRLQHLDGRYFESISNVNIEEMLGIIEVGEEYNPEDRDGTILDPSHEFWEEYVREVDSWMDAHDEVKTAVKLLKHEGEFQLIEPDNVSGSTVYVAPVENNVVQNFETELRDVGGGNMALTVKTDDGVYETILTRR